MADDPDGRAGERARVRALVRARPPTGRPGAAGALDRLCAVAVADLALVAAVVSHPPTSMAHLVAAASDSAGRLLEELQFDTGEGPTGEACHARRPVLVPDLNQRALGRWPGFVQAAGAAGIGAVFAFPLNLGAAMLGALTLYRRPRGALAARQVRTGLILADVAVEILIDGSDGAGATSLEDALDGQAQVYQAQGIAMVQLNVSLPEALARMRAHAHTQGISLATLSASIIDGMTSFAQDGPDQ